MDQFNPPPIEFESESDVAAALRKLEEHPYTLTLECEHSGAHWPITSLHIAPAGDVLILRLAGVGPVQDALDNPVSLHAIREAESIRFPELKVDACIPGDGQAELTATRPRRALLTNKRQAVRVPLVRGMSAAVQLQVSAEQAPVDGRLLDLSLAGGCVEIPMTTGVLLRRQQAMHTLHITFPNGEDAPFAANVCHVRMSERNGCAQVGFVFMADADRPQHMLSRWLCELERETALRAGHGNHLLTPSRLFVGPERSNTGEHGSAPTTTRPVTSNPMVATLHDTARTLADTIIALRHEDPLPVRTLHAHAQSMCALLAEDRACFLYALCCLDAQPPLLQHSIAVAGRLADLIAADDTMTHDPVEVTLTALLHDLGQTLLPTPTLAVPNASIRTGTSGEMSPHPQLLLEALGDAPWLPAAIRTAVIAQIGERLDGSGTPFALTAPELGALARAAAVVDALDTMTRAECQPEPDMALDACRALYDRSETFDRYWVKRYLQRQGIHPIGSLVHFSRGYLAWVIHLGNDGRPARIRVVRHLAGRGRRLDAILNRPDFGQLGELDRAALPQHFGLLPY